MIGGGGGQHIDYCSGGGGDHKMGKLLKLEPLFVPLKSSLDATP